MKPAEPPEVAMAHDYIASLLAANPLREPILRRAIATLALPCGSRGVDVGCGIGLQLPLLAEAIGPAGHVTGVDPDPALLAYGQRHVAALGLGAERVALAAGDMLHLPAADRAFDWAWSADCVGYPAGDLAPPLAELARVVRPGGTIALLGWSSQALLPGHALLEARLGASASAYRPFLAGQPPEHHFARAPHQLRAAGLDDVRAETFVADVLAPLTPELRAALAALLAMLWSVDDAELAPEDRAAHRRLCHPDASEHILDVDGYHAFFTCTLFSARVPSRAR